MTIDLFSNCLKELLRTNDEVVVPGLGTFSAQIVPAGVDENGAPTAPYRKILYSQAEKEDDGLFLRWLAKYLPEGSDAAQELQEFLIDLCGDLDANREVALGDLGQMHSSARKMYYFVSNTGVFEYPDVPGQESIATMLAEDYFDEDSIPIEFSDENLLGDGQDGYYDDGVADEQTDDGHVVTESEPETTDPAADAAGQEQPENPRNQLIGNILLIVFVVLIFLMIAVTLLKDLPWMSNLLDHLLYTKEELEILGK